jgi:hypothetical protein
MLSEEPGTRERQQKHSPRKPFNVDPDLHRRELGVGVPGVKVTGAGLLFGSPEFLASLLVRGSLVRSSWPAVASIALGA